MQKNNILLTIVVFSFSSCLEMNSITVKGSRNLSQTGGEHPENRIGSGPGAGPSVSGLSKSSLADRAQVSSILASVFGRASPSNRNRFQYSSSFATNHFIKKNISEFGWPCDHYQKTPGQDELQINNQRASDRDNTIHYICENKADTDATYLAPLTSTRAALIIRTCDLILGSVNAQWKNADGNLESFTHEPDYAVRNAASFSVGFDANANEPKNFTELGIPNETGIAGAYQLFFPGRELESSAKTALLNVVNESKTQMANKSAEEQSKDAWKFLLLTLCYSGEWQVL